MIKNKTNTITHAEAGLFWKKHFKQFKLSNLTKAKYARKHKLVMHRFKYWVYKFEKLEGMTPTKDALPADRFIPITLQPKQGAAKVIPTVLCTLQFANGNALLIHDTAALKIYLETRG